MLLVIKWFRNKCLKAIQMLKDYQIWKIICVNNK
jgi:hypothetical protein